MNLLLLFLVPFLITLAAIPLTIRIANKYGLVDNPNLRPHPARLHKDTTPRAGGLAIYTTLVLSILIFMPFEKYLVGIGVGITILLATGLIDDKNPLFSPYKRLLLLFLAAGAAVISGIGISFIANPFYGLGLTPASLSTPYISLGQMIIPVNFLGIKDVSLVASIFAFLFIATLTQVINWSKGIDGQMPGITLVTALTLGILSLKLYILGDPNQLTLAKLSFIVAGTSLGFLIFNWHPAKIFPGFSGLTILAFMLASISILSGAKVATALLVLAVPAVDFIYTFARRILSGKSPVWGDRGHLHHRLLDLGLTQPQIALFYIFVSLVLGVVALLVNSQSKFFGVLVVAVIFSGFVLWLNSLSPKKV